MSDNCELGTNNKVKTDEEQKRETLGWKVGIIMVLITLIAVGLGFGMGLQTGGC